MADISQELVDRMVILVRDLSARYSDKSVNRFRQVIDVVEEARANVAELPAPIDPDLLMARQVAYDLLLQFGEFGAGWKERAGALTDGCIEVQVALTAIKRVRDGE